MESLCCHKQNWWPAINVTDNNFIDKKKWGKKDELSDDETGCKRINSLARLSKLIYLEVKPKLSITIPLCARKRSGALSKTCLCFLPRWTF